MLVIQQTPNRVGGRAVPEAVVTWRVLASDLTSYASVAAMTTAGKTAWPHLDPGGRLASLEVRSDDGAGGNGSAFYYAMNRATAPTDDTADDLVSGGGQTPIIPGPLRNLWIRKTVATDLIFVVGRY